jgi:hypothetical protein
MNKSELIIVAAVVTALLAVTSLATYANGVMQYWSPQQQRQVQQNQGYGTAAGGGMMGGGYGGMGGMMGGYGGYNGGYQQAAPNPSQQYYGQGGGMLGGAGYSDESSSEQTANQSLPYCGATGYSGMMGGGYGGMGGGMMMMGGSGFYSSVPSAALTHAEAEQVAQNFLGSLGNSSLAIGDFDEYSHNFYLSIVDKNTGDGVLEVLIDRFTGYVHPEPQSTMWNTGYGGMGNMMGGGMMNGYGGGRYYQGSAMSVSPDQAKTIAQAFLNITYPGTVASNSVDVFPGYYTIETMLNGETYGMLSVNGYTGAVWYHTWHGMFISALD